MQAIGSKSSPKWLAFKHYDSLRRLLGKHDHFDAVVGSDDGLQRLANRLLCYALDSRHVVLDDILAVTAETVDDCLPPLVVTEVLLMVLEQ